MLFRPDLIQTHVVQNIWKRTRGWNYCYWKAGSVSQPGSGVDLPSYDVIRVLFCWACKTWLLLLICRPPASAPKVTCCSSPHTRLLLYHHSIIGQQLPLLCWQNTRMDISVHVVALFLFMHIYCISIHKLIFPGLQEPWFFPPLHKVD